MKRETTNQSLRGQYQRERAKHISDVLTICKVTSSVMINCVSITSISVENLKEGTFNTVFIFFNPGISVFTRYWLGGLFSALPAKKVGIFNNVWRSFLQPRRFFTRNPYEPQ